VRSNKTIHFYGDDTWLKVFPRRFSRSEGVTSFFAADTIEVDLNVTRNLDIELETLLDRTGEEEVVEVNKKDLEKEEKEKEKECDVLLLHYLGLDHIGHSLGPSSSLMGSKQMEMDHIIERSWKALIRRKDFKIQKAKGEEEKKKEKRKQDMLIVVGDHGMTSSGGHGGSTTEETRPLLFIGFPNLDIFPGNLLEGLNCSLQSDYGEVQQIDFVPTVSSLWGLPIPRNSFGVTITSLFTSLFLHRNHYLLWKSLHANSLQISELLKIDLERRKEGDEEKQTLQELFLMYHHHLLLLLLPPPPPPPPPPLRPPPPPPLSF